MKVIDKDELVEYFEDNLDIWTHPESLDWAILKIKNWKSQDVTMPGDFISTMAKYLAELNRCADVWYYTHGDLDQCDYFMTKIDAVKDLCAMCKCIPEVWAEAKKIYDFSNSGREGYTLKDGKIVKED